MAPDAAPLAPDSSGGGARGPSGGPLVFRSRRVLLPEGERPATVHVRDGRVESVGDHDAIPAGARVVDAGSAALLPGLVDTHVHVNEPGRTEWEGFDTATRAAAAGGVTTLIDMPLNSLPPVTDVAALEIKRQAARDRVRVDVGFWAGAVPGNEGAREPLQRAGVFGFKAFLCDSGVREFPALDPAGLARAMAQLHALDALLLVHAEWPAQLEAARAARNAAGEPGDRRRYGTWLAARPGAAEDEAVARVVALARDTGARVHVVHVSSGGALGTIEAARAEGLRVSGETCPHYLALAAEEIPDGATLCKCAPPIRSAADREQLWDALRRGVLEAVVSDHSPSTPGVKQIESGDFVSAWGGIASLGLGLPVVWTGTRERGFTLADVVRWMCAGPARLAGLGAVKGAIAPGCDADLVVFDPDATRVVGMSDLHFRHRVTPYAGRPLRGVVRSVYLRGEPVYRDGAFTDPPRGRLLVRP